LDAAEFGIESAWGDAEFDSSIRGKFEISVLACAGGEVAGFAVASRSDDETAHIHRIVVEPMFRNARVGGQLVNAVEERAVETGALRMTLEFAAALNVAGFYESLGYQRGVESAVRDYLARKGKKGHEGVYLPVQTADRLVYFKSLTPDVVVAGRRTMRGRHS
jgi:ribosomal protein S18 acetylase RimI-like enzyme